MGRIKALIMDVDGTLTNGQINIGADGEVFKSFYCRDGLGIIMAADAGICPVILTSRKSQIVQRRAEELGIIYVLQGLKNNKESALNEFVTLKNLQYSELAYIGDDINDITCMQIVKENRGIIACPADAVERVKSMADYVCKSKGGGGAVREFAEFLLGLQDG